MQSHIRTYRYIITKNSICNGAVSTNSQLLVFMAQLQLQIYEELVNGYRKNVTEEQIKEAIANGATTVDEVGEATGAGTGCGSCKDAIAELLDS